jgi:hypothetical protein
MAAIGDIVLVYEEEKPVFFARIEEIWDDKKPDWYHVKLLVLQVPVVEAVWILREEYINGETFTMNGVSLRLEKVMGASGQKDESLASQEEAGEESGLRDNKVISLFERKKG